MTVLVVGVPDGEQLELLRSGIQRNPHFQVVSHAHDPAVALAHARVLLPDITVMSLPAGLDSIDADPAVLRVFRGVRDLDPPGGVVLRTPAVQVPRAVSGLAVEGAVHIVREGDFDALMRALRTIGLRRASCDPDEMP
ncbi:MULTISPECIES: response regulator [Streptomyces]|uniref:response regulator transcription factor n=1 Tax=Streptomyces TaxID=1883 RepID=UPI00109E8221|nr:response regulator transcription factor [Streptomyces sp. A0592]WSR88055.1 response regulator transcription factor [Streptomyces erythrochromogenes]